MTSILMRALGLSLLLGIAVCLPAACPAQICLDYGRYMSVVGELNSDYHLGGGYAARLVALGDTLLYADEELYAFDVSTPGVYSTHWELDIPGYACDLAAQGEYLYVLNDSALLVVRFRGVAEPALVADLSLGTYGGGQLELHGGVAYLSSGYQGIQIVDISDPQNPALGTPFATDLDPYRLEKDGEMLYAQQSGMALSSFSLADPLAPVEVLRIEETRLGPAFDVTDAQAVIVYGDTLRVLDVSNPALPVPVGYLPLEAGPCDVTVEGTMAYILDSDGAVLTVDLSDPAHPQLAGDLETALGSSGDLVLVADAAHISSEGNVTAVDVSYPYTAPAAGYLGDLDYVDAVWFSGDALYVGLENYFAVLDASDPAALVLTGYVELPDNISDIRVAGTTAYAACYNYGVAFIDVSDPGDPVVVDTVYTPDDAEALSLAGDKIFVASDEAGVTVVDVADPSDPYIYSWWNPGGYVDDIEVIGALAYVANGDVGLMVYDVSDPGAPVLAGVTGIPGYARKLAIAGSHAYVAAGDGGTWVVDVSDPSRPEPVGTAAADYASSAILWHDDILYVAGDAGTSVINVADPANPALLGTTPSDGYVYSLAIGDGVIYQGEQNGLAIVLPQCSGGSPVAPTLPPRGAALSQNCPNPFNPQTSIRYELGTAQPVMLRVYDIAGRLVRTLESGGTKSAGPHEAIWRGRTDDGRPAAAGVYLYELVTPEIRQTRRMTLLK